MIGFPVLCPQMQDTNVKNKVGQYWESNFPTGCPRKNATDLSDSHGSCFILVSNNYFY